MSSGGHPKTNGGVRLIFASLTLALGTEDWVDARIVAEAVAYELGLEERPELVRELSIRLISDLVGDGYFATGELGTAGVEASEHYALFSV